MSTVLISGASRGLGLALAGAFKDSGASVFSGTRDVVTSVLIVLTILFRPYGMFGREDIERV